MSLLSQNAFVTLATVASVVARSCRRIYPLGRLHDLVRLSCCAPAARGTAVVAQVEIACYIRQVLLGLGHPI
jgi:hypothetical protein